MKLVFLLYALFVRSCTSNSCNAPQDELKEPVRKMDPSIEEDSKLNTPGLLKKYGYPVENHTVTTQDGYVLEMHRIPHGKNRRNKNGKAVFLQHGLFGSSGDWVLTGPNKGFAFLLADAGYDVWLGNARGNRYSRKHIKLDPDKDKKKFWDFSWHEIGISDLPSMIDYVISTTGQGKIFYVGYSQGTTSFFVMASERPEYNNKIHAMFAFAPVAYMEHVTSPSVHIGKLSTGILEFNAKWFSMYELLPHGRFSSSVCADGSPFQKVCKVGLFAVTGFNEKALNATILPIIFGHQPAGASLYQVLHYTQGVDSGRFRQYDYGEKKNLKIYGSKLPPEYKLRNVKAPVYLHYSRNDWLSNEKDVMKLAEKLPNLKEMILPSDQKFNHADYLYAIDVAEILYYPVIAIMKGYRSGLNDLLVY